MFLNIVHVQTYYLCEYFFGFFSSFDHISINNYRYSRWPSCGRNRKRNLWKFILWKSDLKNGDLRLIFFFFYKSSNNVSYFTFYIRFQLNEKYRNCSTSEYNDRIIFSSILSNSPVTPCRTVGCRHHCVAVFNGQENHTEHVRVLRTRRVFSRYIVVSFAYNSWMSIQKIWFDIL